jgi:hypothetical protein
VAAPGGLSRWRGLLRQPPLGREAEAPLSPWGGCRSSLEVHPPPTR